ncbi:MAG: Cof-type HAD-IIB family hydrolase [Xanthobacteraceae bacterium]|nr:Cof-type HAD-IIB family hydrolase [Xanthobacteraceae bacterium]
MSRRICLVVSDVDGTLLTSDKRLTKASRLAVHRLQQHGIRFTVVSSRPPFGLRMLVKPLQLTLPLGAFNGGSVVWPDLTPLTQRVLAADAARQVIDVFSDFGVGVWLFLDDRWLLTDARGAFVDLERRTVAAAPEVVSTFEPHIGAACKIVGVSRDFDRLRECETVVRASLGQAAAVVRSQPYYLDVTPAGVDKGTVLELLAGFLRIPADTTAAIGDMDNDIPMFRKSGLRIAVGNASSALRRYADFVAVSNDQDGFADAVDRIIGTTKV